MKKAEKDRRPSKQRGPAVPGEAQAAPKNNQGPQEMRFIPFEPLRVYPNPDAKFPADLFPMGGI